MNKPKIFQGKEKALEIELQLKDNIDVLKKKKKIPHLASIIIGSNDGGRHYLELKKKAAERIGAKVEIKSVDSSSSLDEVLEFIDEFNNNLSVHGVMLQLPLPESFSKKDRDKIINSISPKKDVDGMRDDSLYMTPAVKAVLAAIKDASVFITHSPYVVLVGAEGFVGRKILKALKQMDYEVVGVDIEEKDLGKITKRADILISATGKEGLIKANMIKEGAVVIDVGAPKGDIEFDEVVKKASFISKKQTLFITPVPGGIGPLTISYLLENLVEASKLQKPA